MNWEFVSDDELRAELERRNEGRRKAAEREQEAHERFILEHISLLLQLVPEHGRTSCLEKDPAYNYRRCTRCTLLHIQQYMWIPDRIRLDPITITFLTSRE